MIKPDSNETEPAGNTDAATANAASAAKTDAHDPYAVLRVKDFRAFSLMRLFATLGIQVQSVVVAWQVYDLTHDPLSLGLIGLSEAIPAIAVALYAGHLADRTVRKKIIVPALLMLLLCSLALFTLTMTRRLALFGAVPIYIIFFIVGLTRGFLTPSTFGLLSQIIPRNLYASAATWNSVVWQSASVIGPAFGGVIFGFYGAGISYLVDIVLIAIALGFALWVSARPAPVRQAGESVLESLTAGIRFVFSNQIVLSAISLDLFAVLFGGAVAMLPFFASEILTTGPQGLGLLRAAPALGAGLMAVALTFRPVGKHAGRKLLYAVAGFGVCMILFGLSRNFYLSLVILAASGAFDSVSVVIRSTLLQLFTPDHLKGRVASVNSMFIGSSNEIGAFESGVVARLMGVVPSVVFGGAMTLAVVGVAAFRAPQLRRLNRLTGEALPA